MMASATSQGSRCLGMFRSQVLPEQPLLVAQMPSLRPVLRTGQPL